MTPWGKSALCLSPVEDGDLMPETGQSPHDGRADESRAANDENLHGRVTAKVG